MPCGGGGGTERRARDEHKEFDVEHFLQKGEESMFSIDISYLEFGICTPPETTACLICLRHLSKSEDRGSPIDTLEFFRKIVNSAEH